MKSWYIVGAWITGVIVFIGVWIFAIASWGFLIGIAIGWLPASISAVIAGFLWPLLAIAVVIVLLLVASH